MKIELQPQELHSQKPLKNEVDNTPQEEYKQLYFPIYNAPMTNLLPRMIDREVTLNAITKEGIVQEGALTLFIQDCQELLSPRPSTFILFDMFTKLLTSANDHRSTKGAQHIEITLSISEYMELCGLDASKKSLKDKTRRRVHEDLNYLYNFSLEWQDPNGGKWADFKKKRICTAAYLQNGIMHFAFTQELADSLTSSYISQFPLAIFRLDNRNKNAYALARKMIIHANIERNIERGTNTLLSVPIVLQNCPSIPSYEDVATSDRSFNRRIREALEKALDCIAEADILTWEYSNSKGAPLTEEQLNAADWKTYSGFYIKYTLKDAPSHAERLQLKAARRAKKATSKRKSTPKAPTSEI